MRPAGSCQSARRSRSGSGSPAKTWTTSGRNNIGLKDDLYIQVPIGLSWYLKSSGGYLGGPVAHNLGRLCLNPL